MIPFWQCKDCGNTVVIPTHFRGHVKCDKCGSGYIRANFGDKMEQNEFTKIMNECIALHDKKAHDYASTTNRFSNFEFAASLIKSFKEPIDQVFVCMIGIKLARLSELRNGKEPNNESIRDSHLDLVTYCGLWASYYDTIPSGAIGPPIYNCDTCNFQNENSLIVSEHLNTSGHKGMSSYFRLVE